MSKNTQQPVAWPYACKAPGKGEAYASISENDSAHYPIDQWSSVEKQPLYTAPPVPRDVLMALAQDVLDECLEYLDGPRCRYDLAALADRYASQVQPEPVNQQTLAALKLAESVYRKNVAVEGEPSSVLSAMQAAIAAAEAAQPVGQGLYAILYRNNWDGEGDTYHMLAECKDGKWHAEDSGKELLQYEGDAILRVWPLTDNKAHQPASAQPVAVPVAVPESKPTIGTKPVRGDYFLCQCDKCGWLGSSEETNASIDYLHGDGDYSCPVCGTVEPEEVDSAAIVFNAMLSAVQKPAGKDCE